MLSNLFQKIFFLFKKILCYLHSYLKISNILYIYIFIYKIIEIYFSSNNCNNEDL